jgi:hypothetical protein
MKLPPSLSEKASEFPENSYGATLVELILKDGARVQNVTLAWGSEIVKINGKKIASDSQVDFGVSDILDVLPSGE